MLIRFWFNFSASTVPSPLNLGCGVTAFDLQEAIDTMTNDVFPIFGYRKIMSVQKNIDINSLDENHVRLNMGSPVIRGVWFPKI